MKRLSPALATVVLTTIVLMSIILPPWTRSMRDFYISALFALVGLTLNAATLRARLRPWMELPRATALASPPTPPQPPSTPNLRLCSPS